MSDKDNTKNVEEVKEPEIKKGIVRKCELLKYNYFYIHFFA